MIDHHRVLATVLTVSGVIAMAGCSAADSTATPIASVAPTQLSGTVSLWHFFNDREADVIQSVVDAFEEEYPDVEVELHSGQDDEKVMKAIAAGKDVDVAISYSTDIVGTFCSSGAFVDLAPYVERDEVDLDALAELPRSYTEFEGTRCAMPYLADAFGLYYNKDVLQEFGYSEPPKTLSELQSMALEMTTYDDDGSIKTLGFNPLIDWFENSPAHVAPAAGATWIDPDGTSAVGSDTGWPALLEWQQGFVQAIGYDKLQEFTAGLGQEFSAGNPFHTGQVAMNLDGEWRTAFINDQAPDLNYGTAPFPTADDHTDLYGGGYVSGNIAGIGKGSDDPELAWALLQYLTTDTKAVVRAANGLGNIPTTADALTSPDLQLPEQFGTFVDILSSPHSATTPPSRVGAGYQQSLSDFWAKYQNGDGDDLEAGLKQVDEQVDNQLALTAGP